MSEAKAATPKARGKTAKQANSADSIRIDEPISSNLEKTNAPSSTTTVENEVDNVANKYLLQENQASSTEEDHHNELETITIQDKTLPSYNVPEHIIIVYDCTTDESSTKFLVKNEENSPDTMLKKSLQFFIRTKNRLDKRHQFALVVLNDNNVVWLKDFTSNIELILSTLEDIHCCEPEDIISLDKLFELIDGKVKIPPAMDNFNVPPTNVVRVLFTYGRSYTMPHLNMEMECYTRIISSPYFIFDVLMTHEVPNSNNHCTKIFKYLQEVDSKGISYSYAVERNAKHLFASVAKLLSHPLQRPFQNESTAYQLNLKKSCLV